MQHFFHRLWMFQVTAVVVGFEFMALPTSIQAQVVQLPSVSNFGTTGAVSVPDGGQAYLGGYGAMRSSSRTAGGWPAASRSASQSISGGSISVTATIIDLQAMDAALLAQPVDRARSIPSRFRPADTGTPIANTLDMERYRQFTPQAPIQPEPNAWRQALGSPGDPPLPADGSLAGTEADVRFYLQKAQDCTNSGRMAAARVYFDLAYQKLTPAQRALMREHQAQEKSQSAAASQQGSPARTNAAAPAANQSGSSRAF